MYGITLRLFTICAAAYTKMGKSKMFQIVLVAYIKIWVSDSKSLQKKKLYS